MLVATPIWAFLVLGRVLFYLLEHLRFPQIVPPATTDAVQGILLWPLILLGCHLTLLCWRRQGTLFATAIGFATALLLGAIARPVYAIALFGASLTTSGVPTSAVKWILSDSWWPWVSNTVEYSFLYISGVGAVVAVFSFRSLTRERGRRARLETAVAQERLCTLRAQMSPHFLFNALNSIVSLSEAHSPSVRQLIALLTGYLRRTLAASEQEEHSLSEELEYVDAYLGIQQYRNPSRLRWRIDVAPNCTEAETPTLLLQPIVENAVTHGLRGGAHCVEIDIRITRLDNRLVITITNNCAHMAGASRVGCAGVGLRNLRERLDVLYGANARLTTGRLRANWFVACIELPFRCARRNDKERIRTQPEL